MCYIYSAALPYARETGIAFGISKEDSRIWLDGKSLRESKVTNSEKFFKKGSLIPSNSKENRLTCTHVEAFGLFTDHSKKNFGGRITSNINTILAQTKEYNHGANYDIGRSSLYRYPCLV